MSRVVLSCLTALVVMASQSASAYLVANSVSLDELAETSEVIFKGTVIGSDSIEDASFKPVSGFAALETRFRVVSVVKGKIENQEVRFRHYGVGENGVGRMYMPQYYEFEIGRSYIVCAKSTDAGDVLRQIWDQHRAKVDQGVLRAADDHAHQGNHLNEVYWHELKQSLRSGQVDDAIYAIDQINSMTGIGHSAIKSLDRDKALNEMERLVDSPSDEVAVKTLESIGLGDSSAGASMWRLFTINPAHFPGHSTAPPRSPHVAAQRFSETLIRVAKSGPTVPRRAAAIASLSQAMNAEFLPLAKEWIHDDAPQVRSAATIMLADFADQVDPETWDALLADESKEVRLSAIMAIGFGQVREMMNRISGLLHDPDPAVVSRAAATLLSFPLQESRAIFKSRIDHPQYGCLFINALAAEDTAAYADRLGEIIRTTPTPAGWWGGHVTWGVSWNLLFKYVQSQPAERLQAGDFDAQLDSLESPVVEREQSNHYSSSEPRDLYALYVQRGMRKRAAAYRQMVNRKTRYDMNQFFDQVDQHPNHFQRS